MRKTIVIYYVPITSPLVKKLEKEGTAGNSGVAFTPIKTWAESAHHLLCQYQDDGCSASVISIVY